MKICPLCGKERLVDYNESQISLYLPTELPNAKICEACGYYTCDSFTKDFKPKTAKIIIDNAVYDSQLNLTWYPIMLDIYKVGAIYPDIVGEHLEWKYTKYIAIPMVQRTLYPIDKQNNLYQEYILDFENSKPFVTFDDLYNYFLDILKKYND